MVSGAEAGLLCWSIWLDQRYKVLHHFRSGVPVTKVARAKAAPKFELCSTNDPAVVTLMAFAIIVFNSAIIKSFAIIVSNSAIIK
jgi:hypothetical protein